MGRNQPVARPTCALSSFTMATVSNWSVQVQASTMAHMAVGMKQGLEQNVVGFGERPFELRKPMLHARRDGCFFRFCQHSHYSSHRSAPPLAALRATRPGQPAVAAAVRLVEVPRGRALRDRLAMRITTLIAELCQSWCTIFFGSS